MKKIITGKMIRKQLGANDGHRVRIKRNSLVFRQRNKGDRWEYCGTTTEIAHQYAEENGIREWELESVLQFDDIVYLVKRFQENGLTKARDMMNFIRMASNEPFDDIYKDGVIWKVGTVPKEAEGMLFFDPEHQDAIREEMGA